MENPMLWVGYPRSYSAGRSRAPQFVVLHYTAGSEGPLSAENGANYDKTRADGTSCHAFFDSEGPGLQEVPFGDRSHSAFFHGNEIGIQYEICGTIQTRAQWLDDTSFATLVTCAKATRYACDFLGLQIRRMTTAEVRAAYYNSPGFRPTGICDHKNVTDAFPEDGGTHTDVGPEFPWDVFMDLVGDEVTASDVWQYPMKNPGGSDSPDAEVFLTMSNYYSYRAYLRSYRAEMMLRGLSAMQDPIVIPKNKDFAETASDETIPNKLAQALLASGGGPGGLVPHIHDLVASTGDATTTTPTE